MKNFKSQSILVLIFICAVSLGLIAKEARLVEAKGVSRSLFDSPPPQPPNQFDPGQTKTVIDPDTPSISFFFQADTTNEPIEVETYYADLPVNVPASTGSDSDVERDEDSATERARASLSRPFFFGAWIRGKGVTIREFNASVIMKVKYDDPAFSLNMIFPGQEQRLRVYMYNPALGAWVKLCSSVDIYRKEILGVLYSLTPYQKEGNTLFIVGFDNTPTPVQVVDTFGKTSLSIEDFNVRFQVLPGVVALGDHFEITKLPNLPDGSSTQLEIDIKACRMDHSQQENSQQLVNFQPLPRPEFGGNPFRVEFDGRANLGDNTQLTIATLQEDKWVNLDQIVKQDQGKILLDTDHLGTFRVAAK